MGTYCIAVIFMFIYIRKMNKGVGRMECIMKVLVASHSMHNKIIELKEMVPQEIEFILPSIGTDDELVLLAKDVEIILCNRVTPEIVKAANKLKLIQKIGVGVDSIPFESFKERDICVSNTAASNAIKVAEYAFALLLTLAKKIVPRHYEMRQGVVDRSGILEVRGKTIGILGFGNIGQEVAKRALAFDMKIVVIKRHPQKNIEKEHSLDFLGGIEDLAHVLKISDFIVITLPLTPETRGMIGESELKMMEKTAFLINVSRAAVVNEKALFKGLKERWIAGAALDVWYTPHWWNPFWTEGKKGKPSNYPILELDNVIVTPELADSTGPSKLAIKIVADNIVRILKGKNPISQVDRILQY